MNWAEDHLDSNETAVMHRPASEVDEVEHYYCQDCEIKFEEPQESPYCESCEKEREIKALKIKIGELEFRLQQFERFATIIKSGVADQKNEYTPTIEPTKSYCEGMMKEKELVLELLQNMRLV